MSEQKVCECLEMKQHDLWELSKIGIDGQQHHPTLSSWLFKCYRLVGGNGATVYMVGWQWCNITCRETST